MSLFSDLWNVSVVVGLTDSIALLHLTDGIKADISTKLNKSSHIKIKLKKANEKQWNTLFFLACLGVEVRTASINFSTI